jgi:uncharacterized protein YqiB (DUF1249 family)
LDKNPNEDHCLTMSTPNILKMLLIASTTIFTTALSLRPANCAISWNSDSSAARTVKSATTAGVVEKAYLALQN